MDNITTGLQVAAEELKQLKADIEILDKESLALKPTVDQFENKRKEIKALRKTYNEKKETPGYCSIVFYRAC